jgi:hypothetical protein
MLPSRLNPLRAIQSYLLCQSEKSVQFCSSTYGDEKVLCVFFDSEDRWQRHANLLKKFRIDRARKLVERIEEWISGQLDGVGDVFQNEPKTGGELEIKQIEVNDEMQ